MFIPRSRGHLSLATRSILIGTAAALGLAVSAILVTSAAAYNDFGSRPCKWSHTDDTILDMPYPESTDGRRKDSGRG